MSSKKDAPTASSSTSRKPLRVASSPDRKQRTDSIPIFRTSPVVLRPATVRANSTSNGSELDIAPNGNTIYRTASGGAHLQSPGASTAAASSTSTAAASEGVASNSGQSSSVTVPQAGSATHRPTHATPSEPGCSNSYSPEAPSRSGTKAEGRMENKDSTDTKEVACTCACGNIVLLSPPGLHTAEVLEKLRNGRMFHPEAEWGVCRLCGIRTAVETVSKSSSAASLHFSKLRIFEIWRSFTTARRRIGKALSLMSKGRESVSQRLVLALVFFAWRWATVEVIRADYVDGQLSRGKMWYSRLDSVLVRCQTRKEISESLLSRVVFFAWRFAVVVSSHSKAMAVPSPARPSPSHVSRSARHSLTPEELPVIALGMKRAIASDGEATDPPLPQPVSPARSATSSVPPSPTSTSTHVPPPGTPTHVASRLNASSPVNWRPPSPGLARAPPSPSASTTISTAATTPASSIAPPTLQTTVMHNVISSRSGVSLPSQRPRSTSSEVSSSSYSSRPPSVLSASVTPASPTHAPRTPRVTKVQCSSAKELLRHAFVALRVHTRTSKLRTKCSAVLSTSMLKGGKDEAGGGQHQDQQLSLPPTAHQLRSQAAAAATSAAIMASLNASAGANGKPPLPRPGGSESLSQRATPLVEPKRARSPPPLRRKTSSVICSGDEVPVVKIVGHAKETDPLSEEEVTMYHVEVTWHGETWVVKRRFRRFLELQDILQERFSSVMESLPPPPGRTFFTFLNSNLEEERVRDLQKYLVALVEEPRLRGCRDITEFLLDRTIVDLYTEVLTLRRKLQNSERLSIKAKIDLDKQKNSLRKFHNQIRAQFSSDAASLHEMGNTEDGGSSSPKLLPVPPASPGDPEVDPTVLAADNFGALAELWNTMVRRVEEADKSKSELVRISRYASMLETQLNQSLFDAEDKEDRLAHRESQCNELIQHSLDVEDESNTLRREVETLRAQLSTASVKASTEAEHMVEAQREKLLEARELLTSVRTREAALQAEVERLRAKTSDLTHRLSERAHVAASAQNTSSVLEDTVYDALQMLLDGDRRFSFPTESSDEDIVAAFTTFFEPVES